MDRVRNDEVRRRKGVVKELDEQAEQGMLWFGDVERMEGERLVKITRSDVRGVSPKGTPCMGWLYSVKTAMGARVMSVEQGRVTVCVIEMHGEQL